MQLNLLMVVTVAGLVGPRGRSLIRSAGHIGVVAYKEVFATARQGMWVELPSCPALNEHGDVHAPLHAPLNGTTFSKVNRPDAVVVFDVDADRSLMTAKRFVTPIKQVCNRKDIQHAVIRLPVAPYKLTILRGYFMMATRRLRTLTFHGLENITYICPYFLQNCKELQHIDLSAMTNIRTIAQHFMSGCSGMKSVQFGEYSQLGEICESFMYGCSSVTSLEFSGFRSLHRLDTQFLADCSALESVAFNDWGGLHNLPPCFMSGCSSLKMLDTRGIGPGVPAAGIGPFFLNECTSLSRLILPKLASVGHSFLRRCSNLQLKDIDFGGTPESVLKPHFRFVRAHNLPSCGSPADATLPHTASVVALLPPTHQAFVRSAGSLGHAAFEEVVNAKRMGVYVEIKSEVKATTPSQSSVKHAPVNTTSNPPPILSPNATAVFVNSSFPNMVPQPFILFSRVNLVGMENVTKIEPEYGQSMESEEIEIVGPMNSLKVIGNCVFYGCRALRSIRFPPLPNLTKIDFGFMAECTSITHLELSGLGNLAVIETYFLKGCTSLVSVDLGSLPSLRVIERLFLEECAQVTSVTMLDMMTLEQVVRPFLENLPALTNRNVTGNHHVSETV